MIIELWEKRISLLESMAIQIIGMFQYQIKKDFLTVHYFYNLYLGFTNI